MSKYKNLLQKLNIDETFTKAVKPPEFNHVKDNIPMIANYNFMADLLFLPDDNGFKYLFVIVDLATDKFDCEPVKTKDAAQVLKAMQNCFKRKFISQPNASIRTDGGKEFHGVFQKWLYDHNILHKEGLAGRHNQVANVENLNKLIGRFLNGYMNATEVKTGKVSTKWIAALPAIRKSLNEIRTKKMPKHPADVDVPLFDPFIVSKHGNKTVVKSRKPKFSEGQSVYYVSPVPLTALGKKQSTTAFRVGDRRWSKDTYPIKSIYSYSNPSQYRYALEGVPGVSFTEQELMLP